MGYWEEIPVKVVRGWDWSPREAVSAPVLAVPKARLEGAWSNLGQGKVSLPMGWHWMDFKVSSNSNHSKNSVSPGYPWLSAQSQCLRAVSELISTPAPTPTVLLQRELQTCPRLWGVQLSEILLTLLRGHSWRVLLNTQEEQKEQQRFTVREHPKELGWGSSGGAILALSESR